LRCFLHLALLVGGSQSRNLPSYIPLVIGQDIVMEDSATLDKGETSKLPNFQFSGTGHAPADETASPSAEEEEHSQGPETKAPPPLQKRRRVTRACDECRRKKIKCDGKQPCTHCTVYSYG
jgi:hypothetical protein